MTKLQRVFVGALIIAISTSHVGQFLWRQKEVANWVDQYSSFVSAAAEEALPEPFHCELVHINIADSTILQTLPGIGPVYAESIIELRQKTLFTSKDDLLEVNGIGPVRLARIYDLVCLEVPESNEQ